MMNNKQSAWKLLTTVLGTGLLITNCTVKSATDDGCTADTVGKTLDGCTCPGNVVGHQLCQADGTYGSCICPTGSNGGASSGGASSGGGAANDHAGATSSAGKGGAAAYAGATSGDAGTGTTAGAGGEAGAGDAVEVVDCYSCLIARCAPEWDACTMNDETHPDLDNQYCISSNADGSGQIERIIACITDARAAGLVKRDQVRECGSSVGASSVPTNNFSWPPATMTPETENLMNCMADSATETMPGNWANADNNFPAGGPPRAWDAMTCAKDFCTSAQ